MMNGYFKWLCQGCMTLFFGFAFSRAIAGLNGKMVYIVDIDNTLSDTWPSLKDHIYRDDNDRYRSLSIFIGMRNYLLNIQQQQEQVIFVSARSYLSYATTRRWLEGCGLKDCGLILVPGAMEKLSYLLKLVKRKIPVVYIDDLSYNHERGEVKRYDVMLSMLNMLPVTYIGLKEIEEINAHHEDHAHTSGKIF